MKIDELNEQLKDHEVLHGAESAAAFNFLKEHFEEEGPKYKTFKYAYFSPTSKMGGAGAYGIAKNEEKQIVGHLKYYGIKEDDTKVEVANVSIKLGDLNKELEVIDTASNVVVIEGEDPVKGEKLITEFNEIAEEKLLKTTIPLDIKGSKIPLPVHTLYHWVGDGGWVYNNDNTYYYLSLSTNGWDNTQKELEDVVNNGKKMFGERITTGGGGRKRRRKTKRKRTKRRKTKRKRSRRKRTMKRKKRRGKKRRGKTRRRR